MAWKDVEDIVDQWVKEGQRAFITQCNARQLMTIRRFLRDLVFRTTEDTGRDLARAEPILFALVRNKAVLADRLACSDLARCLWHYGGFEKDRLPPNSVGIAQRAFAIRRIREAVLPFSERAWAGKTCVARQRRLQNSTLEYCGLASAHRRRVAEMQLAWIQGGKSEADPCLGSNSAFGSVHSARLWEALRLCVASPSLTLEVLAHNMLSVLAQQPSDPGPASPDKVADVVAIRPTLLHQHAFPYSMSKLWTHEPALLQAAVLNTLVDMFGSLGSTYACPDEWLDRLEQHALFKESQRHKRLLLEIAQHISNLVLELQDWRIVRLWRIWMAHVDLSIDGDLQYLDEDDDDHHGGELPSVQLCAAMRSYVANFDHQVHRADIHGVRECLKEASVLFGTDAATFARFCMVVWDQSGGSVQLLNELA
ncbi:hypothetical protein BZG36_02882 [Bifiguratus adelaidae]|uniref:Uncharacterized protein n=1 Tax=Bifiguratus adelaidae TaxID=1938954 RepID=A0A261Y239_9FUNG|nr:hypothetical protein BZG36_02882 [Bifiguratus adelaidae]